MELQVQGIQCGNADLTHWVLACNFGGYDNIALQDSGCDGPVVKFKVIYGFVTDGEGGRVFVRNK